MRKIKILAICLFVLTTVPFVVGESHAAKFYCANLENQSCQPCSGWDRFYQDWNWKTYGGMCV
jgi:hypothetical protein